MSMQVHLGNDCSIRVHQLFVVIFYMYYDAIMLNAFSDLLYAQNYTGIISWSLIISTLN